ncbi:MAG TPA: hypothetical protein VGU61_21630 [Noviherbaspirillum sp.]|nr:hypothetical protein [Noviherbaspirillum sp.]
MFVYDKILQDLSKMQENNYRLIKFLFRRMGSGKSLLAELFERALHPIETTFDTAP